MGSSAHIRGMAEFRKALKDADADLPKELRAVHAKVAKDATGWARNAAMIRGRETRRNAAQLRPKANQKSAYITILANGPHADANVAFFGAKRRTGWYSKKRYEGSTRQHPEWVGNSWEVGVPGQGPYAINDSLANHLGDIDEDYMNMIFALAAKAFPDK